MASLFMAFIGLVDMFGPNMDPRDAVQVQLKHAIALDSLENSSLFQESNSMKYVACAILG